jgi:tetratricopeptide (TPR) repeat protein
MGRSKAGSQVLPYVLGVALQLLGCVSGLEAQFGPMVNPAQVPQARSQEELDTYLANITETDPQKTVKKVESFTAQYPKSELVGIAYEYQMHAYVQMNDFDGVLRAGEKALLAHPGNLNTLLPLASALASRAAGRPDRDQLLERAEGYAHQALKGMEETMIPRQISLERWEIQKRELQAEAHEVFGEVAMQRGQVQRAVSEFEMAVRADPNPQGIEFLRLGAAYELAGDAQGAERTLHRAAELGPAPVRQRALTNLKELTEKRSTTKRP